MAIEYVKIYQPHLHMTVEEKKHICDDCGWAVLDLENRVDIEWWSDDQCGCFRRDE